MSGKLLITGVPKGLPNARDPGPRLEISTFVKDHRQFSLYVQALDKMMYGVKPSDVDSYFSLSSVHGWPTVDWNQSPANGNIFCAHRSQHFPTWHRPYVAVYEQTIQKHATAIAATYTTADKNEWLIAAANLRQPYWGWDNRATFIPPPEVISLEEVSVTFPDGHQGKLKNPLFSFTFPEGWPEGFQKDYDKLSDRQKPAMKPFLTAKKTVRHSQPGKNESQPDKLIKALSESLEDTIKDAQSFFSLQTWPSMVAGATGTIGLEDIHGSMHVITGGSRDGTFGHMSQVPVAGFDPIFWLHHAQVDRMTELWFVRHKQWVPIDRDLNPFWKQQTAYWKSKGTTDTSTDFNYVFDARRPTFPIIASVNRNGQQLAAKILPVDAEVSLPDTLFDLEKSTMPVDSLPQAAIKAASAITLAPPQGDLELKEWIIQIRIKRFEIPGSFIVCIFVGDVPSDVSKWVTDRAYAGSFEVFDNIHPEACPNCSAGSEEYLTGYVHCNFTIASHLESENPTLDDDDVVPLLKKKLSWGVIELGSGVVDLKTLPSLAVTFGYCPLSLPQGTEIPSRGEPVFFHDVQPHYKATI